MIDWQEHTKIIRKEIHALEDEDHLQGAPDAFIAVVKIQNGLSQLEEALRHRDSMNDAALA